MTRKTYLSVDIGSRHTRAWLFDDRDGHFALLGSAISDTSITAGANIQTGVVRALTQIQKTSGYRLLDHRQNLIHKDGDAEIGVDGVGVSLSAGPPIKTVLLGVSDTYSIAALRRVSNLFYTEIVAEISLQDGLNATAQLQTMMNTNADLFIIAGGVDGGASRPVRAALDNARIVYQNLPRVTKPQLVFTGNAELAEYASKELDFGDDFHLAGNIQPRIGRENLITAWKAMCTAFARVRRSQIEGLAELEQKLGVQALPTSFVMGRMLRFLDQVNPTGKGIMVVDVGGSSTTILATRDGDFVGSIRRTEVTPDSGRANAQFSSLVIDPETASIYMHNKQLHPAFLPSTLEDLAIEHAWTRVRIQDAMDFTRQLYPDFAQGGLRKPYEPIILSGESLVRVPAVHQALLIAMDGLQPHGITTFAMDREQILVALGSLAELAPMLVVQVVDSGLLHNLGTCICVESTLRAAKPVLSLEVDRGEKSREYLQVHQGELKRIETAISSPTRVYLSPGEESDVGMGLRGLGGWVSVAESEVGIVIDARGRPLGLPEAQEARSKAIYDWLWELGG